MAAGDPIDPFDIITYFGVDQTNIYITDSTNIGIASSRIGITVQRGVSLLSYNYLLQQRNASDSSWMTVASGSVGSSGSVYLLHDRWTTSMYYRPRWRYYRSSGNGAATMRVRGWGRGWSDDHIYWCNAALAVGSIPADNWRGNTGWRVTWARRVNLANYDP